MFKKRLYLAICGNRSVNCACLIYLISGQSINYRIAFQKVLYYVSRLLIIFKVFVFGLVGYVIEALLINSELLCMCYKIGQEAFEETAVFSPPCLSLPL